MITVKYVLILIRRLIKRSLDIHVGCFQLRTRYPTYSSFCVTTTEHYADIIMCSNVWPRWPKIPFCLKKRSVDFSATDKESHDIYDILFVYQN